MKNINKDFKSDDILKIHFFMLKGFLEELIDIKTKDSLQQLIISILKV